MLKLSTNGFVPIRSSLLVINARRVTPQRGEHDSTSGTGITNDAGAFDLDEGQTDLVRAIVSPGVAASVRCQRLSALLRLRYCRRQRQFLSPPTLLTR